MSNCNCIRYSSTFDYIPSSTLPLSIHITRGSHTPSTSHLTSALDMHYVVGLGEGGLCSLDLFFFSLFFFCGLPYFLGFSLPSTPSIQIRRPRDQLRCRIGSSTRKVAFRWTVRTFELGNINMVAGFRCNTLLAQPPIPSFVNKSIGRESSMPEAHWPRAAKQGDGSIASNKPTISLRGQLKVCLKV